MRKADVDVGSNRGVMSPPPCKKQNRGRVAPCRKGVNRDGVPWLADDEMLMLPARMPAWMDSDTTGPPPDKAAACDVRVGREKVV